MTLPETETAAEAASTGKRRLHVVAWPALETRATNPYTWLLYSNMSADVTEFSLRQAATRGYEADILHLHWPESLLNRHSLPFAALRAGALFRAMDRMRARGTKVVWTFHNEISHERRHAGFENWFWKQLSRRIDGVFALSRGGETILRARKEFGGVPVFIVPHGHYRGEYADDILFDARAALGIPRGVRVILFFGQIRPYKNVPALIEAFLALPHDDTVLLIAGNATPEMETAMRAASRHNPRIHLSLRTIAPEKVFLYFRAADLVVLPYRRILNSGTALLALSFDRPVLVPNKGSMAELVADAGAEWVRVYEGEISGSVLRDALVWHSSTTRACSPGLGHLNWPAIAKTALDAYGELIAGAEKGLTGRLAQ